MVPVQHETRPLDPPARETRPLQGADASLGISEEPRGERLRRHGRRQGLYLRAGLAVVLLGLVIALVAANTRTVEIDWLLGTTQSSVAWIVFVAAVVGALFGVLGGALLRRRTRQPGEARRATR